MPHKSSKNVVNDIMYEVKEGLSEHLRKQERNLGMPLLDYGIRTPLNAAAHQINALLPIRKNITLSE
jgi:hypothetical protein